MTPTGAAPPMARASLRGSVERITFYNPENGYTVLRLRPERRVGGMGNDGLITVVGNLPQVAPGEHLELLGRWVTHTRFGRQFQAETCRRTMPATAEGILRYLGSGLVKGVGKRLAERIVAVFGEDTLKILDTAPERLREVPGIGPKRAASLRAAWEEQKHIQQIMLFLHSHGVTTGLAVKIYKTYGDDALQILRENPYQLAEDIRGIGFKTADKIARALGLPEDHPSRLRAGLVYALNRASEDGQVYLPKDELLRRAAELLEADRKLLEEALDSLIAEQKVVAEEVPDGRVRVAARGVAEPQSDYRTLGVYLPAFHVAETGIAERLKRLLGAQRLMPIAEMPREELARLSEKQAAAVETALRSPVSVLTGGPGTGKTTALRALIVALDKAQISYALAAPTGRAAKRLAEATGRPASTIHRLLGYKPGEGFRFNPQNPLPHDFLVVDEASMIDLILAYHLLGAVKPGAHLLLVGDVDQLPSVGAGDFLRHVIASGLVPVTRLTEVFRQAADSLIITNAHRINRGLMPLFPKDARDFFLFPAETPEAAADWVVDVVTKRIPRKFGLRAPSQIQVITPMYRGAAGVHALNARLQAALNPPDPSRPEVALFGQLFRLGDWVMQTRNNYDLEVFNGDLGAIVEIDRQAQTLTVYFEGRRVRYAWSEADQLTLAYAISVHKAQGAEFPAVVIPVVTQHYMLLRRNLLYTAVTRAQKLCVLVGQKRAIGLAVRNATERNRYSALAWRLMPRAPKVTQRRRESRDAKRKTTDYTD